MNRNRRSAEECYTYVYVTADNINVTIHIPKKLDKRIQSQKINRIYDILSSNN